MENSMLLLLAFSFIALQVLTTNATSKHPLVPAIYVFGDSHVDAGNNNHLNTPAKANRWPYGIDLNNIWGRFTNGKNGADFAAIYLGLPMPPPYLNLSDCERSQITTGINYASGACGILNTTGAGECLTLAQQVKYFTLTATNDLPKALKKPKKLQQHLAKSIYLLLIGTNDYIAAMNHNITKKFTPQGFADYLLDEITKHIKTLFDLGARKFMVSGISTCEPYQYTKDCESRYYADKLPKRLLELQYKLSGSLYTIYDGADINKKILEKHEKYGIKNIWEPCYVEGKPICLDRSKFRKFDQYGHQTEVTYEIAAKDCFNGTTCSPYTLLELAKAPIHHHGL